MAIDHQPRGEGDTKCVCVCGGAQVYDCDLTLYVGGRWGGVGMGVRVACVCVWLLANLVITQS